MFNRKESPVMNSPSLLRQSGKAHWPWHRAFDDQPRYQVCDRLHKDRIVNVRASEIAGTVSIWLADLGVQSPLVEQLAAAVQSGDWANVRAICERLSVDVSYAA